jgi:hypothetical protein
MNLSNMNNPWSTFPYGPATFSLLFSNGTTTAVTQTCTGIFLSSSKLATINEFGINIWTDIGFTNANRTGYIKISNPLPSNGGQLQVIAPLSRSHGAVGFQYLIM